MKLPRLRTLAAAGTVAGTLGARRSCLPHPKPAPCRRISSRTVATCSTAISVLAPTTTSMWMAMWLVARQCSSAGLVAGPSGTTLTPLETPTN